MNAAVLAFVAALTAATVLKPEIRSVRIFTPRLVVSREHADSDAIVTGQIRVDMSFAKATVRCPVLRLVCLCEVNGVLAAHAVFLDRTRTCDGMRRAQIMTAFKNAGIVVPFKERDAYYGNPAKFTACLPEVVKSGFANAVYGSGELNRGFFRLGRSGSVPKILLYRIEMWQNGCLVASSESSRSGLGTYDIPEDWHVWKKYPQRFKYATTY